MKALHQSSKIIILTLFVLTAWLLEGTASLAADKAKGVSAPGKGAEEGWEGTWKKTVEAGKKERKLSVYAQWGSTTRAALGKTFKEEFGIDIEFTSANKGNELAVRLDSERRAGLYLADVIGCGATTIIGAMAPQGIVATLEPMLILPEVLDPTVRRGGKIYMDKAKYVIPLSAEFNSYITRNTELVKEGEIKSYLDLLEPKWKGKIIQDDPTMTGQGNAWVSLMARLWGLEKARDYLKQLRRQEPAMNRNLRLQAEWLARGKYAVGAGLNTVTLGEFEKMGAPVARVRVKEGGLVTAGGGCIGLPAGQLPHPNAAKVFINWLMTRSGQTLFSKLMVQPSMRVDVSIKGFEDAVPLPGEPFIVEDEEGAKLKDQLAKLSKDIYENP